jgi:hypothetical protein
MQVKFAPTAAGAANGTLTLIDAAGTQSVSFTGTGTAPATDSPLPTALSFSATPVGTLSAPQTITLTNAGDLTLTGIAVSLSGPYQTSNTCGTQLTGQASCSISVIFSPTAVGSQPGTLNVSDALRTQSVALSGTGLAPPVLSVNPSSLNFTGQQAGAVSAPQTLTMINTGGAPMANLGFQLTGSAAASYSISANTCGSSLNAGASCTLQIAFTPAATGAIAATLTVSSSTSGVMPVSVSLNGTGQVSGVAPAPSQLNFSTVGVGQSSSAQSVTITNGSNYAIPALTLAASAPFALSQNNCTGGLAAGANCNAAVTFQPNSSGVATGALIVTSSALPAPASVALSGMGFDFAAAVSGSSTFTVASGQTANFTLTINPANGAAGVFTYTCGALPANSQCVFNPTSTTITTGATGTMAIAISTGKASTARLESPGPWRVIPEIPMACGLLLVPFVFARRRKVLLLLVLLAVLVSAASSCSSSGGGPAGGGTGGGSGGSGGGLATPPGTYSIPVTIASTGVTHAVTVTLTVD